MWRLSGRPHLSAGALLTAHCSAAAIATGADGADMLKTVTSSRLLLRLRLGSLRCAVLVRAAGSHSLSCIWYLGWGEQGGQWQLLPSGLCCQADQCEQ